LNQVIPGAVAVGSDLWQAEGFYTGTNTGGYILDSILLNTLGVRGDLSGFTVMLYSTGNSLGSFPGSSLDALIGPTDPSTAGTYTYTAPSNLTLSPSTTYFIVLTSGTAVANGAYEWSFAYGYAASLDGWNSSPFCYSDDGRNWNYQTQGANGLFAINATVIPEPTLAVFILLGSGALISVRRNGKGKSCNLQN
jgi:hypothetical protein